MTTSASIGSTAPSPSHQALSRTALNIFPRKPSWSGPRIAASLNRIGLLTQVHRTTMAAYCQCYGLRVEAEQKLAETLLILRTPAGYIQQSPWLSISNKQLELMARYMAELGLTPASRSRLAIQIHNRPKPWEYGGVTQITRVIIDAADRDL